MKIVVFFLALMLGLSPAATVVASELPFEVSDESTRVSVYPCTPARLALLPLPVQERVHGLIDLLNVALVSACGGSDALVNLDFGTVSDALTTNGQSAPTLIYDEDGDYVYICGDPSSDVPDYDMYFNTTDGYNVSTEAVRKFAELLFDDIYYGARGVYWPAYSLPELFLASDGDMSFEQYNALYEYIKTNFTTDRDIFLELAYTPIDQGNHILLVRHAYFYPDTIYDIVGYSFKSRSYDKVNKEYRLTGVLPVMERPSDGAYVNGSSLTVNIVYPDGKIEQPIWQPDDNKWHFPLDLREGGFYLLVNKPNDVSDSERFVYVYNTPDNCKSVDNGEVNDPGKYIFPFNPRTIESGLRCNAVGWIKDTVPNYIDYIRDKIVDPNYGPAKTQELIQEAISDQCEYINAGVNPSPDDPGEAPPGSGGIDGDIDGDGVPDVDIDVDGTLDGFLNAIESVGVFISSLGKYVAQFGLAISWIPEEILAIIIGGTTVCVIAAVISFLRG